MTNIKKLAIALLLFSSLSPMTQAWVGKDNQTDHVGVQADQRGTPQSADGVLVAAPK